MKAWITLLVLVSAVATAAWAETPSLLFVRAAGYGSASTFEVALGDLDGDGDLDAVFANMDCPGEVWLNSGSGSFANSGQQLGHAMHGVALGDLDGDGDLDILTTRASRNDPSGIYVNDGSGRFRLGQNLDDATIAGNCVQLFDLEGDGDLDAGIYYSSRLSRVYVNDGTGRFTRRGGDIAGMAVWGDLDGDGDADAVAEQHTGGFAILWNTGEEALERGATIQAPGPFLPGDSSLCDVNGDALLDVVCSGGQYGGEVPITVLLNDGAGGFVVKTCSRFAAPAGRVATGDFDGDGMPDVLIAGALRPGRIGLNDGTGDFVDAGILFENEGLFGIPAIGDLDGDKDPDILFARYDPSGPNEAWMNDLQAP